MSFILIEKLCKEKWIYPPLPDSAPPPKRQRANATAAHCHTLTEQDLTARHYSLWPKPIGTGYAQGSTIHANILLQTFNNIDNPLCHEYGCSTKLDCTEQTSRLLFLKYLAVCGLRREYADTI